MIDDQVQNEIYSFIEELFPICRSITGNGTRETLRKIQQIIPIQIKEVLSGTKVFDWEIPKEWNVKEAYIKTSLGEKVVDFKNSNLHLVNYSIPIHKKISLTELKPHLYSLPEKPNWIPYKTSYYKKDWGFCLSHKTLESLKEDIYEVVINSELTNGALSFGELYLRGEVEDEVLISTHICHPSMCNDNLSGISVNTFLAQYLNKIQHKYSYRFLFIPATIGAITWLSQNESILKNIKYGIVTALLGDNGKFIYKKSRNGNSEIDRIFDYTFSNSEYENELREFTPYGYDERQFCSPGINLPMGRFTRTPNQEFLEYHTSADNLDFISAKNLYESYSMLKEIIQIIENNRIYENLNPKCEPQLGKRGIYNSVAGDIKEIELAMLWVLNYSDGTNDLISIAKKSKIDFKVMIKATEILIKHNLLKKLK